MTVKKLSQLYYFEQDKRRLTELEAALTSPAVKIDGLPHIREVSNKAELAADIAAIRDIFC